MKNNSLSKLINLAFVGFVLLLSLSSLAQSPGNVSTNLSVWLKANVGVSGTTNVSSWADQSGNGNNAIQNTPANQPALLSDDINSYPSINFSTSDNHIMTFSSPLVNLNTTVFTVATPKENSNWRTMFRGNIEDHPLIIGSGNNQLGYYDNNNVGFKYSGFNWNVNETALVALEMRSGDVNFRKNGTQGASINSIDLTSRSLDHFGNFQGGNQEFGRINETVIYNGATPLTNTEKNKIESYLAIKYAITLNHDYLSSSGTVIWNQTSNSSYHNDVAGIGRDDASGLSQEESKSINSNSKLTMQQPSGFSSDNAYLVWGKNTAPNGTNNSNVPAPYVKRLNRIWKTTVLDLQERLIFPLTWNN